MVHGSTLPALAFCYEGKGDLSVSFETRSRTRPTQSRLSLSAHLFLLQIATQFAQMDATITESLDMSDCRDLGSEATITISSAKPGNGVEQLRDGNLETYWQSDGSFPHSINIQFLRRVSISKICLYLDYGADESYTPKKVSVSSGTSLHDLYDVAAVELNEPVGWVTLSLSDPEEEGAGGCLRTHLLQVKVLAMHQNGRDTHVRQVRVLGPRESHRVMGDFLYASFATVEMQQFALLR
jgi:anaphase-promoting complex subunit 10